MATKYRFGDSEIAHFITFAVVNWIDALSRPLYKDIFVESLRYCQKEKGLRLYAWVIMSKGFTSWQVLKEELCSTVPALLRSPQF